MYVTNHCPSHFVNNCKSHQLCQQYVLQNRKVSYHLQTVLLNKKVLSYIINVYQTQKRSKTDQCGTPAKVDIILKNRTWVWSGNTTITNCRQPLGTARKSRSTITRHQEDKLSKATSSLFPIKMIAILERT